MTQLTSRERFLRMYRHEEADRIPILDSPWSSTIERWENEGMPRGADYRDYFDLDKVAFIYVDNSPCYETKVLEETEEFSIVTTEWGATLKNFRHRGGVPEFLDFRIKDYERWLEAKKRMTFDESRIPWDYLKKNYARWVKEGMWITANFWFGFDVSHSWAVGTERFLMAMIEDPDWCTDMYDTYLKLDMALMQRIWDAGYRFDEISWPNDMGYKQNQFFSMSMFRRMDKPYIKRAIDWAHERGAFARLHSCGDITPFVPELVELGLDALNPLEVKAGMNPAQLKKAYGDKLVFHGGINAVLWDKPDLIKEEIRRVVPVMKENGGYIFSSDHSIPENVSLEDFKGIIEEAKKCGKY